VYDTSKLKHKASFLDIRVCLGNLAHMYACLWYPVTVFCPYFSQHPWTHSFNSLRGLLYLSNCKYCDPIHIAFDKTPQAKSGVQFHELRGQVIRLHLVIQCPGNLLSSLQCCFNAEVLSVAENFQICLLPYPEKCISLTYEARWVMILIACRPRSPTLMSPWLFLVVLC
jgi:hypothetical protein